VTQKEELAAIGEGMRIGASVDAAAIVVIPYASAEEADAHKVKPSRGRPPCPVRMSLWVPCSGCNARASVPCGEEP
jgi:hypothetical protein